MTGEEARGDPLAAPSLRRRLACFLYEGVLLFGVVMIAGYLYSSLTQQRNALQGRHGLQAFLFVVLGIYFVWFWSRRGQTLPMQTWHIRVETRDGRLLNQGHALVRYLACWVWIVPAALVASLLHWSPWQSLGAVAAWIAVYAALARLHPQRQFWHDAVCKTRLVPYRPSPERDGSKG
jgi:uncharacterized RDD family membrane protein YckC